MPKNHDARANRGASPEDEVEREIGAESDAASEAERRAGTAEVPTHVARNVETVHAMQAEEEQRVTRHQRAIESVTAAIGQPAALYTILAAVALWTALNTAARHLGVCPLDDPPFFWLQGAASLGGLLIATMVLITQNRQARLDARRAHLDLQVNLLAEQKIAKLIALVEELRRDLPSVRNRRDVEAESMAAAADPRVVIQALEAQLAKPDDEAGEVEAATPAAPEEPKPDAP
jgi:uncharacterized membrane protein